MSADPSPPPLLARLRAELAALGRELRGMLALRWEMARLELTADLRRLRRTVWMLLVAAVMALAALPLLLAVLAELLAGCLGIGRTGWLAILASALLAGACLLAGLAWRRLRARALLWEETLEELHEDVRWLGEWAGEPDEQAQEPADE